MTFLNDISDTVGPLGFQIEDAEAKALEAILVAKFVIVKRIAKAIGKRNGRLCASVLSCEFVYFVPARFRCVLCDS
jgi:hypothetical protein